MRPSKIPKTKPIEGWLNANLFDTIRAFISQHPKTYAISLTCLLTIGLIDITIPWLVGQTIDQVEGNAITDKELWQIFALLIVLGAAMYGLRFFWRWVLFGTSYRLSVNLRNYLYQRLSKFGPAFYQNHRTGDLMARATNDVDNIEMTAGEAVLAAFDGLLTFILVVTVMVVTIDWRLALLALVPFPIMAWIFKYLGTKIHNAFTDALDCFSTLNDHTQQSLNGFKPLKAMGLQSTLESEFNELTEKARKANIKVARIEALFDPLVLIALGSSTFFSLLAGTWLIWHDEITVGQLTSFYLYQGHLIWPMFAFGWFLNLYNRGSAALERYHELVTTEDSIPDNGRKTIQSPIHISVNIQQYAYEGASSSVLSNVQFEIETGKTLGIVGPTGSGKTTLLALLQRQFELNDGVILINNTALKDIPLSDIRNTFTLVPQEPILFSDTLEKNIVLGAPESTQSDVKRVVEWSQLTSDLAQMKDGLNTIVGEKGVTLSGGQRQRVALARALLRESPVLILDDTLSAVDTETEKKLLAALNKEKMNRSMVIVSHRLSAVRQADHILVLNHGRIIEEGSHKELMGQKGWYAKMYAHQQLEETLDE